MDLAQKTKKEIDNRLKNLEKVKAWKGRAEKLSKKKTMAAFCRDHGINVAHFSRIRNLSSKTFPEQKFIDQVENAFKKEGV